MKKKGKEGRHGKKRKKTGTTQTHDSGARSIERVLEDRTKKMGKWV